MRKFLKDIDWKAVWKAAIEIIRSIGRGDFLLKLRVDKLFPYILHMIVLGIISIALSYGAEKTMHKVEVNKNRIESLKYANANKHCEIIGLSRISTVERMLVEAGSQIRIPEKPAYTIKK